MKGRIGLRWSIHRSIRRLEAGFASSPSICNNRISNRDPLGANIHIQSNRHSGGIHFRTINSSGFQPATTSVSQDHDDGHEDNSQPQIQFDCNNDGDGLSSIDARTKASSHCTPTVLFPDEKLHNANQNEAFSRSKDDNLYRREVGSINCLNLESENYDALGESLSCEKDATQKFGENDEAKKRSVNACSTSMIEMLRNFDPCQQPTSRDLEELQLWLECFSQRETVLRHQDLLKKARDRKAFDSMSVMQRHVVQWFQGLRDAIEIRQKEFLSSQDKRRASNRYGPFICSLHPDKMAVILSQEAITQALLNSGKDSKDGIPLVKIALAIGAAVETEVVSQRRMKERFYNPNSSSVVNNKNIGDKCDDEPKDGRLNESEIESECSIDRWSFSASHLKLFYDDLQRFGMGKSKRAVRFAMRRTKKAMNSSDTWSSEDLTHLGAALLSILTEHANVNENGREEPAFRVEKRWSNNGSKSISFITIHDRIHKIFLEDEYLSWAANTTRHMPMVVPPSDWTDHNTGGYRWLEVDMMRTHRSNVQKEALQHADISVVCDGLNILGKTPWKINKKILEVGEYCWENDIPIGDIPSRTDLEVPPEPIYPSAAFDADFYSNKDDPKMKEKFDAIQSYRDSTTKFNRVLQKNMVCITLENY